MDRDGDPPEQRRQPRRQQSHSSPPSAHRPKMSGRISKAELLALEHQDLRARLAPSRTERGGREPPTSMSQLGFKPEPYSPIVRLVDFAESRAVI